MAESVGVVYTEIRLNLDTIQQDIKKVTEEFKSIEVSAGASHKSVEKMATEIAKHTIEHIEKIEKQMAAQTLELKRRQQEEVNIIKDAKTKNSSDKREYGTK